MIARIFILIILATLLPDMYIYHRYVRRRFDLSWLWHVLWWLPGVAMIVCTVAYAMISDFAPDNLTWFNLYLFMLGLIVLPKVLFVLSSLVGRFLCHVLKLRRNWGNYVGLLLVLGELYVLFTGSMTGVDHLSVRHVTLEFADLPQAFDGYRIVQFSDAHVGSIRTELLQRAVAEINSLSPDAIVFTGDLQNKQPSEIQPYAATLRRLHSRDGVFSVLGNHDYSMYMPSLPHWLQQRNEQLTQQGETALGWTLLLNDRHVLRRGQDSIVIAGEENDGRPPFPKKADMNRTLRGISPSAFVIMLQHDPSAWRRSILPGCHAQLTLSGHTHGGQMSFFGFRPTKLSGSEDAGLYRDGSRCLYVSTGLGGFVPFRFHMNPEVVEITLRKSKH